jgi:hypothetical protein
VPATKAEVDVAADIAAGSVVDVVVGDNLGQEDTGSEEEEGDGERRAEVEGLEEVVGMY